MTILKTCLQHPVDFLEREGRLSSIFTRICIRLGRKFELKVGMSNYLLYDKLRLHSQIKIKKISVLPLPQI